MSRTADQITDDLCANLQTEFTAIGERVVTAPRSPMRAVASALSLEIEGAEAEAAAARLEALPGTASEDGVLAHADAAGLVRVEASRAVLRIAVTGTPSTTGTVPDGKQLTSPTGLLFNATAGDVAFDGSGVGYTTVTARDTGAAGNLALDTVLTWQGAPSGFGATAATALASGDTTHVLVVGADLEDVGTELRARAVAWWKERAQGGNRAEWAENVGRVEGVGDAFVWPRATVRASVFRPNLPGVLIVIPLAPAPASTSYVQNSDGTLGLGLSPAYSRIPSDTLRTRVRTYIEGTHDRSGVPVPSALQKQRRPAGMGADNWQCRAPSTSTQNITLALSTDPAVAPWPWGVTNASVRYIASATTTALTLDDVTDLAAGSRLAVDLGTSHIRGAFWLARVQGVVGSVVTLTTPLPVAPSVGAEVRPDCGLWAEARAASLGIVDNLGPGDAASDLASIPSQRYPRPSDHGPDRLFTSRLVAAAQNIVGVAGVSVNAPATSAVPIVTTPLLLVVPGVFKIIPP